MRTSVEITNQEVAAYTAFCRNHHVFFEGEEGVDNGNFVRDYFLKTWGEDITEANLDKALPYMRPHLKFKSEAYLKLEQAANGMTPQEAESLTHGCPVSSAKDQGMENATNILSWLRERNLEIITLPKVVLVAAAGIAGVTSRNSLVCSATTRTAPAARLHTPSFPPPRRSKSLHQD